MSQFHCKACSVTRVIEDGLTGYSDGVCSECRDRKDQKAEAELENVIAKHTCSKFGEIDCPACAQRRLAEYVEEQLAKRVRLERISSPFVEVEMPPYWKAVRRALGMEAGNIEQLKLRDSYRQRMSPR